MWGTNLRILAVVLGTIGLFTLLANTIPQVQSEVPQELNLTGNVTPEQLVAAGDQLFNGAGGCTACHGLGTRAPNLLTDEGGTGTIGARCTKRKQGMSCKDYLHESMVKPGEFVVPGYQPIMPDMTKTLSPAQIWTVVAFLESNGGEVDVTADDAKSAGATNAGSAPAGPQAPPAAASLDPATIMKDNNCLACHKLGNEGQTIAPNLTDVGSRLKADEIRESILDPNAKIAKGFEAMKGLMPTTFGTQLSAAQLEALVKFLAAHK